MANTKWNEAIAAATSGLASVGARERKRHARAFAFWCAERELDPVVTDRSNLEAYLSSLPDRDAQRQTKVKCALRAVLREIDVDRAARVAGLGNQLHLLKDLPSALAALVDVIVERQPKRRRVVASALTRLFAWCREVDADPLSITPTDLPQFRRWLIEVGTTIPESVVVAGDFLELRYSARGLALLGLTSPPRGLSVALGAPLRAVRADLSMEEQHGRAGCSPCMPSLP
jgi:hypothetical protein